MVIEYAGNVVENLNVEQRMTICNMSIECGARAGLISPDKITFDYLKGKKYSPKDNEWDDYIKTWKDGIVNIEIYRSSIRTCYL